MTFNFYKNLYFGVNLTDEQMADIPRPRFELHYHVLYKTVQMGSILGLYIIGPTVGLIRGRSVNAMINAGLAGGRIGAAVGVVAGPIMTEATLRGTKATPDAVYDRSYRIRYNYSQMRTDRFATIGAIAGAGAAPFLGASPLNAGIVGLTVGTLFGGFYNNVLLGSEKPSGEKESAPPEPQPESVVKEEKRE